LQIAALFLAACLFHHFSLKKRLQNRLLIKTRLTDSFLYPHACFAVSVGEDINPVNFAKMAPALRLLLAFLAIGPCIAAESIDLWPMPKSVSHGTQKLYIKNDISMSMVGTMYSDEKAILKDAFQRMVDLITMNHVADGRNRSSLVLTCVNIVVHTPEDEVTCLLDLMNCCFIYRLTVNTSHLPILCSSTSGLMSRID
jgi:hypothetical protein